MLNNILSALYKQLRLHSGLSRKQFAGQIGVSLNTLTNYEKGNTRPEQETELKMVEVSGCSDLEIGEILCEILSQKLRLRVGIVDGETGYLPASPLANAKSVRRHCGGELEEDELRALADKLHTGKLLQVVWERYNDDLDDYAAGLRSKAERRRSAADRSAQGATGAARVAAPDFHNAARGRCSVRPPSRGRGNH